MKISTVKAKQVHVIASKIPSTLWECIFNNMFEDDELPIAKTFSEAILGDLPKDSSQAFIILLICYPKTPASQFIPFARDTLNLTNENLLHFSAAMDKLDALNMIKKNTPNELKAAINSNNFFAFRTAAESGNLEILRWLKEHAHSDFIAMIRADKYYAFRSASGGGHLETLLWFKEHVPNELSAMIKADNYDGFRWASQNGHLHILKWHRELVPDDFQHMIEDDDCFAFRAAGTNGYIDILRWFKECASNQLNTMIKADNYYAFRAASQNTHLHILKWLLLHPECFAYAEEHVNEFGDQVVNLVIQEELAAIHQESELSAILQPNAVFDIHEIERSTRLFYIIRNMIRRNDRLLDDELRFCLDIPSVRALSHQEITQGNSNELLLLALIKGNVDASQMLLNIDSVYRLAEQRDFYQEEISSGINLRMLAQNSESAMTALSVGETKRLDAAIQFYQPMIQKQGTKSIMENLREAINMRYRHHPATIIFKTKTYTLPLEYGDYMALNLCETDRIKALHAYYTHPVHTAWRYLSKPNFWMHPQASHVLSNEDGTQFWSTFEEYKYLITMLYLAASDIHTPATEGYTIETRLNHYIEELALIGRAHNWDKTHKEEEYDDLDADKPSCFSGVKRRLFQSVQGHPLFNILTKEKLHTEIRDFAIGYFKSVLTDENKPLLKEAYVRYVVDINEEAAEPLKCLNIPEAQQESFNQYLTQQYGVGFTHDNTLISLVHNMLFLSPHSPQVLDRYHALKLEGITNFFRILEQLCKPHVNYTGFFAKKSPRDTDNQDIQQECKRVKHTGS